MASEMPPVEQTQYVPDSNPGGGVVVESRPAQRFGRFRVESLLGVGATGTVYRAHDDVLNRLVAVKALHGHCDPSVRARFHNEARAIGSVLHPNILAVYDAGTEANTPYIVIELATGSLRDVMRAQRLDVEAVRRIGIQIARALAAAHAAKILHRDVKPANILTTEPDVWKLADFGIARLPDSTLTDTGQFLGSPSYAAPESLRKGEFTPASDIYALAATLYEALAGAPPHGDHDMTSVVRKLDHDPLPLQLRCPVPRPIADAIMAALARDPAARPSADDFARCLAGNDSSALILEPAPKPSSGRITGIAIAAAIVAACLLALAIVVRMREPDPHAVYASPRVHQPPAAKPTAPPEPPAPAPDIAAPTPAEPPPAEPTPPAEPAPPAELAEPAEEAALDPWGEPVDDDHARRLLEELERDARREWNGIRSKRKRKRPRYDPF